MSPGENLSTGRRRQFHPRTFSTSLQFSPVLPYPSDRLLFMPSADRLPLSVAADDIIGAASSSWHCHRIFPGESYDDDDCQQDADLRIPASREPARHPTNSPQLEPRTRYMESEARRQHASRPSPPSPSIEDELLIIPEESERYVCDDLSVQYEKETPANDDSLSSEDRPFSQEIDSQQTLSVSGDESVHNASISDMDEEEIARNLPRYEGSNASMQFKPLLWSSPCDAGLLLIFYFKIVLVLE